MPLVRLASGSSRSAQADPRGLRIGTLRPTVDMGVRVEALIAAGRLGDERVIPSLIKLMSHREISMRQLDRLPRCTFDERTSASSRAG